MFLLACRLGVLKECEGDWKDDDKQEKYNMVLTESSLLGVSKNPRRVGLTV